MFPLPRSMNRISVSSSVEDSVLVVATTFFVVVARAKSPYATGPSVMRMSRGTTSTPELPAIVPIVSDEPVPGRFWPGVPTPPCPRSPNRPEDPVPVVRVAVEEKKRKYAAAPSAIRMTRIPAMISGLLINSPEREVRRERWGYAYEPVYRSLPLACFPNGISRRPPHGSVHYHWPLA